MRNIADRAPSQSQDMKQIIAAVDGRLSKAAALLDELKTRTSDGIGVTRSSFGPGEQVGHDLMGAAAAEIGLEVTTDAIGNLYARLPGADREAAAWVSGSHLDSVPRGGNFDGAAGAVAALVSVAAIKDLGILPRRDVVAMAIRAEECSSWFTGRHGGHLGSRAALGLLAPSELDSAVHIESKKTLAQSVMAAGFDSDAVRDGAPPLSVANVRGFIELHIEQGPVLVNANAAVGIVTGIRGTVRARKACCIGTYAHSGAVPQELRKDAVLATAELISRIDQHCANLRENGKDVVFTIGRLHTNATVDSLTKVPGEVQFTIDLRSQDERVLSQADDLLDELGAEISRKRSVQFDLGNRAIAEPTIMDPDFRGLLRCAAAEYGIVAPEIACGAGHDAAEFVRADIPACMIFVRNTGESHSPTEHMDMADFRRGVLLLTCFLLQENCQSSRASARQFAP